MHIEKGSILTNIMDIHGNTHKKIEVINVYENTLCVVDLDDYKRWIVHKINVGMKPIKCNPKYHHNHFNLRESQHQKVAKRSPVRVKRWAF
jgi:starvation-inducible outer membrane lipoprotein